VGETELLERIRGGDVAALEELYDLTGRRAFGVAYAVLRDGAEAEDVVQEAYVWLWEHSERLDASRGRVESLLLTIVHRRAIDVVRARARRSALHDRAAREDAYLAQVDETAMLDASFEDAQALERAREAMRALPEEQRQPIELAYFEGLTQQAVAERLGVPLGTVKSRLRLGLQKLREQLIPIPRGSS
jgi:RNA polymerase sigma-70 factor (ECF subfamily)